MAWWVIQELTKLRAKITSTVQVLTHLKEKLQFVNAENLVEKQRLQDVEKLVAGVSRSSALSKGLKLFFTQTRLWGFLLLIME